MGLYAVRVRGIYATALAVALHERGFLLADLSDVLRSRLDFPEAARAPDVTVKSLEDSPDEILVIGHPWEAGAEVERAILDRVGYAAVVRGKVGLYTVADARSLGGCRLELPGGVEARLDAGSCPGEGEAVRVTVVREAVEPGSTPVARREVRLIGPHVMVSYPGRGASFSEHIRSEDERAQLLAGIIGRVDTNSVHVHFRSAARLADPERVAEEAVGLARRAVELYRQEPSPEPRVVERGEYISIVYLPRPAKEALDELRARVYPTVKAHHTLKAGGREESLLVDYAEEALRDGTCNSEAGRSIEAFVAKRLQGRRVSIDHRRPDRSTIRLGPFTVETVAAGEGAISLTLKRTFTSHGVLDGLNVEKRPGDQATTRLSTDSWVTIHEYTTPDGRLLGVYANINTPPEISSRGIRYLDLYVDVVMKPGGEPEVIDEDQLDKAYEEGLITEELYRKAREEAARIARTLPSMYR